MIDLSRWPAADDLLDRALELPRDEREAFVRQAAGTDAALAEALAAVLSEDETVDGFLEPGGAVVGAVAADLAATAPDQPHVSRLQIGRRFGVYDIVGILGHGGMGEVYRARDTRLGRDVAIKVLPWRFAGDADRHERLTREARLLAALNHPNIAAIYDLEEHDGVVALVLELVEGPTLADRLEQGRLPIGDALAIAEQVARALAAAHQRGIVHSDLKPGNIKITPAGQVKVLDFGIGTVSRDHPVFADTSPAALDGLASRASHPVALQDPAAGILGTASYLSPERARGQPRDARSDTWAFGCVLFEMLTGVRAFDGPTAGSILVRVLEREPEFSRLPVRTPAAIVRLLERALRKDPERRLGFIGDALLEIEDARAELSGDRSMPVPRAYVRRSVMLTTLALAGGLLAGTATTWLALRPVVPRTMHLAVPVAEGDDLVAGELPGVAISPDGSTIVYRVRRDGVIHLVRHSLDSGTTSAIEGTDNAASPFFSPDGAWLGFAGESKIYKVRTAGGRPIAICDAPGGARASWGENDTIVFSAGTSRVLHKVSAAGGAPTPLTTIGSTNDPVTHESPALLPGGRAVVFAIARPGESQLALMRLDTGETQTLTTGRQPLSLGDGWIAFTRGDALWCARVDADAGRLVEQPTRILEGLELGALNGTAHVAASVTGTLVYMPHNTSGDARTPVWISRDGREEAVAIEPRPYTRAAVSPDGNRIALAIATPEDRDIWVYEIARRALMRLTLDPGTETAPIWSPDGKRIAYRSDREGGGIFIVPADGAGSAERLTRSDGPGRPAHTPYAFTPDGRTILYAELRSYSDQGIGAVTTEGVPEERLILDGPFAEARPALSPDGRWLAYQSDETGRFEIYVRPYPDLRSARVQVSTSGGSSPRWSPDGRELFYFDGSSLVSVAIQAGSRFAFAAPTPLFDASAFADRLGPLYDVAPDGHRFLFLRDGPIRGGQPRRSDLRLVTNWTGSLRR